MTKKTIQYLSVIMSFLFLLYTVESFATGIQGRILRGKTAAPAVTNDIESGYRTGDIWIDETADKGYLCLDNATGTANWLEFGTGSGSGTTAVVGGSGNSWWATAIKTYETGSTVYMVDAGSGVSISLSQSATSPIVFYYGIDWTAGTTFPRLAGVTQTLQPTLNQLHALLGSSPYATQAYVISQITGVSNAVVTGASLWVGATPYIAAAANVTGYFQAKGGVTTWEGGTTVHATNGNVQFKEGTNITIDVVADGSGSKITIASTASGGGGGSGATTFRGNDDTDAVAATIGSAPSGIFVIGKYGIASSGSGNTVYIDPSTMHSSVSLHVANAVSPFGSGVSGDILGKTAANGYTALSPKSARNAISGSSRIYTITFDSPIGTNAANGASVFQDWNYDNAQLIEARIIAPANATIGVSIFRGSGGFPVINARTPNLIAEGTMSGTSAYTISFEAGNTMFQNNDVLFYRSHTDTAGCSLWSIGFRLRY